MLRRLVEAGTKIVQLGYAPRRQGDADDIVDRGQQAEVYDVTDAGQRGLPRCSAIMLEATLDEIEAIGRSGGEMVGVPTGFADLDELTNGLHPGQMIVVAGRPGHRQGAGPRHAAPDADRLDDDGRTSRSATGCSAPTDARPRSSPRPR